MEIGISLLKSSREKELQSFPHISIKWKKIYLSGVSNCYMFRAKVIGPHCALESPPRGAEGRGFRVSGGEAQRCAWAETRRRPWTFQAQLPSSDQAPLGSVPTSELLLPTRWSDKPLPPNENSSNTDFKKSHVLSHRLHPVCASHPHVGDSVHSTHPQRPPHGFLGSLCAGSQVVQLSALGFVLLSCF